MSYASKIEELIVERDALKLDLALSHTNEDEAKRTADHFKADAERYRYYRARAYKDGSTLALDVGDIDDVAIGDFGEFIDATADAAIADMPAVG